MPASPAETAASLIRPLVLVVDDDPAVLEALRALLAPLLEPVYRVETAASAEEALELVATADVGAAPAGTVAGEGRPAAPATPSPVALVISDERMPGLQGTDLLIALRQSPAHRHGGRMIITAYAGLASAKKAINEAEVDRYYPKPWDAEGALLPAVAGILGRFAEQSGLDRLLVTAAFDLAKDRDAIRAVRRAWWEYLELMGLPAEEAGIEVPAFEYPGDGTATHIGVTRLSPRERTPVD